MLEEGRGSLPFALVHGEALVACAAWALGDAGVTLLDTGTTWESIREADETVVLHDSLCPLTPAEFLASCVELSRAEDALVVATRPVTDTIKVVTAGVVGQTVDRDGLTSIASPVVLPPSVVAALPEHPAIDFVTLVAELARSHRIMLVEAPASARRVTSTDDLPLLEALTAG